MWTNVPIPWTRPWEFPNKYFHTAEHISVRLLRSDNPNSETEHVCHPYKSTLIYFSIATYLNGGRNRVGSRIDLCSIKDEIMSLFGSGEIPVSSLFRVYSYPPAARNDVLLRASGNNILLWERSPASVERTADNYWIRCCKMVARRILSGLLHSIIFARLSSVLKFHLTFCVHPQGLTLDWIQTLAWKNRNLHLHTTWFITHSLSIYSRFPEPITRRRVTF